ncbi:hypothetical protein Tco_1312775 [Tanacetum coccineum]
MTSSYALSWKPCQGDSLNLPDHRIHKDRDGDASFQLESDSLPHAHAQTTKTYYKHQDLRIMKAQELKTKTSAQTLIYKIFLQRYQVYQGRLLASFQDDAKYEHVGQDTRSQVGGNLRVLSAEEAWETIEDCAQYDKQWKNPTSTIPDQTIANLKTQLVENEVVRVRIPKCMAWLDDEPIRDPNTMEDKVDNPSPQRIPIEEEPLDHMKLEDLGLNTCSHDLFPSSREFPSVDESEPQPLPNLPFLDVNLGDKRGTDPLINPYTPDSFRMKVIFDEKKLGSS